MRITWDPKKAEINFADTIRLISARKATPTERKQYEKGI